MRDIDALGRLGGDEFVVVAEGMSLAAGPELIAERLLASAQAAVQVQGAESTRLIVTASVGSRDGRPRDGGRAPARRRHRDVPRKVGRQEPLRGV